MNILIPDSWLREFLNTEATPQQIKEYLSLCGPSVERIHKTEGEVVYDIEVTSNRPDSMSVVGIAREATAILPRFGVKAELINDPYADILRAKREVSSEKLKSSHPTKSGSNNKRLTIQTDPVLNPRWTSVVLDHVIIKSSPHWLQKRLELTGIRPLNNIVDITNYLMRAYGQPAHAFDYDEIKPKNGIPALLLRASKKDERITTLDGKTHTLPGDDIVIADGSGRLIDLCGIMGAENSSIKSTTKSVVLFMQTYNPVNIRKTSMSLAHRTEAAQLFEKGLDSELVLPTVLKGIELVEELAGGKIASKLYDLYPNPYTEKKVAVARNKVDAYIGVKLTGEQIKNYLTPLGLQVSFNPVVIPGLSRNLSNKTVRSRLGGRDDNDSLITVTVPSFRPDIEIDVDIIEEIARIYGYHHIESTLPDSEPPVTMPDSALQKEEELKIRLRDWGFTETYTYSMISEELMDVFNLDKQKAYKITNPLSSEWVYMRPVMLPGILQNVRQNLNHRSEFKTFELSNIYKYRENDLPEETPILVVTWIGEKFYEAKGLAEELFDLFGLSFGQGRTLSGSDPYQVNPEWNQVRSLLLGDFGIVGEIKKELLAKLDIKSPIAVLKLNFAMMVASAKPGKLYQPIPKYPPVVEDFSFVLPTQTPIGEVVSAIKAVSDLIYDVTLLNRYESTVSFRVQYLNRQKQLTDTEVVKIRHLIQVQVEKTFAAKLKV